MKKGEYEKPLAECKILAKEIAMNIVAFQNSGHDPMGINFKKIYDKYPKVNVGIRRMLVYIKKEYGIEI